MTIQFSVTQNGKPLDESKYKWDEETCTFSTDENNLVIDFCKESEITFNTGDNCTFNTGSYCTFNTGNNCTFKTGSYCTFNTGWHCTFNTSLRCTFKTGKDCTFKTGAWCTFTTGKDCTFKTGSECTFTTDENCFLVRCLVKGVTEIPQGKTIKLNEYGIEGYTIVEKTHTIKVDGKTIELSEQSYNEFKEQFKD